MQGRQVERRSVEGGADDPRCRLAAGDWVRGRFGRPRRVEPCPELDQRERCHGGSNEPEEDEPALAVDLERRRRPAYLTVSVPVIPAIGWIEQMNVYVPAWSALYW